MAEVKAPAAPAAPVVLTAADTAAFRGLFKAEGKLSDACAAIGQRMLAWHAAGAYPVPKTLAPQLITIAAKVGVTLGESAAAQYASGMVKWAKAGQLPEVFANMKALQGSVPGAKGAQGRKPTMAGEKAQNSGIAADPATDAPLRNAQSEGADVAPTVPAMRHAVQSMLNQLPLAGIPASHIDSVRDPMLALLAAFKMLPKQPAAAPLPAAPTDKAKRAKA